MGRKITAAQHQAWGNIPLAGNVTHDQIQQHIANPSDIIALLKGKPFERGGRIDLPEGMNPKTALELLVAFQKGIITQEMLDPLHSYRQFSNCIVIGPWEVQKAFLGPNGKNPLDLPDQWVPRDIPMVITDPQGKEIEITPDLMRRLSDLCKTLGWDTRFILWLCPPSIPAKGGDQPTHLINQYEWWGVEHDSHGPGSIRDHIFWSNWFLKESPDWASQPASNTWRWRIGYEHLVWTAKANWTIQQERAKEKSMPIMDAPADTLMLNLVLATTGAKLRTATWSRASTIYGRDPLHVDCNDDAVYLDDHWDPVHAYDGIGASVEGVPSELVS